jgi:uncharacterized repeat protein (TIGR03837 family)
MQRWDIFCRVVDNYGDIGVCWRLARQLASEHGLRVRLWVDDLSTLQPLQPDIDPALARQESCSVEVRHWGTSFDAADIVEDIADVVIEAFVCELPENYQKAMAARASRPAWINLEYLSAEAWVEGCHAMPSPHPRLPLTKYFFFPGFGPATGGLLREHDLLQRRDAWQQQMHNEPQVIRELFVLPTPAAHEVLVSLFCYDNAPIQDLLQAWQNSPRPVRCLVPQGKALTRAAACLGVTLQPGETLQQGNLSLHALPFLPQQDYDRLLWSCDINFVRGEDSFVRAQWAARPMVWQIYPQQEDAHRLKLEAFLDRYCLELPPETALALRNFHLGWNGYGNLGWDDFLQHLPRLQAHARAWAQQLSTTLDLASKLVIFCKNRV